MKCLSVCNPGCHHRKSDNRTLLSQEVPSCFLTCSHRQKPVLFYFFFLGPNRLVLLVLEFNINGIIQHAIFCVSHPSLRIMFAIHPYCCIYQGLIIFYCQWDCIQICCSSFSMLLLIETQLGPSFFQLLQIKLL